MFCAVLMHSYALHCEGYVHGDVRIENMLFSLNLIDFDLSRKKGTSYPSGYFFHPSFRHNEARSGFKMEVVHDLYALMLIITYIYEGIAPQPEPTFESLHALLNT